MNDFSQKFVDEDAAYVCHAIGTLSSFYFHVLTVPVYSWKAQASATLQQLQAAVSQLLRHSGLPDIASFPSPNSAVLEHNSGRSPHTPSHVRGPHDEPNRLAPQQATGATATSMAMTRENSQEGHIDESELVMAPMRSLYEVTKLRNLRNNGIEKPKSTLLEEDFISRGHVFLNEAEELYAYFSRVMNQLLWGGIILPHPDLTSVRRASSVMSAAVLTVAALHIPNRTATLNICYNEYVSLVSNMALTRSHTLDDIRGLCVGAFWLSDLSWKLSGQAVRIATELSLHQAFHKMTRGHNDQYERAQLWYLLYVCDHHFSLAYGRPPVIHEDAAIRNYEQFLKCPQAVTGDVRLMGQVALFITLTEAYRTFGTDSEQALNENDFSQLRVYNIAVDQWRLLWQPRSADSPYVRTYPSKGVVLHYHFAKFQLNSLALRAVTPANTPVFSMERKECANTAISAAMACLNLVLDEADVRDAIVGVPIFTHSMVTFCALFLLKVTVNWNSTYLNIDGRQVRHTVERVIDLMTCVSAGERHLTRHISRGLTKILERFNAWEGWYGSANGSVSVSGGRLDSEPTLGGANPDHSQNSLSQAGYPPPDLIYDMVGTYGFGFDENFLDPKMTGLDYLT